MCFDLLLPSSMFTSVCFFRFGFVWFALTVYKITRDFVIRIVQFVMNTRREFRTCILCTYIWSAMHTNVQQTYQSCVRLCAHILNGKWRTKWHVIWSKHQIWSYSLYQKQNRTMCVCYSLCKKCTRVKRPLFTSVVLSWTDRKVDGIAVCLLEEIASTNH